MQNGTYTCGGKRVVVEGGLVVYSDTPHCVVGHEPNKDFLRRTGWKKAKRAVQIDVWGRRIN